MTERLRALLVATVACLAGSPAPASAHRLDEYLQATRLGIERGRIDVEIDLTPGANIASQIMSWIDVNGDGHFSETEKVTYVRQVMGAIALTVDGQRVSIHVDTSAFPAPEAMTAGIGTIRIRGSIPMRGRAGSHHLSYVNSHRPETGVYLVNALLPSDARVAIAAPRRDPAQRTLELDFDIEADPAWTRAAWVVVALALLGTLGSARRHRIARAAVSIGMIALAASIVAACGTKRPSASSVPLDKQFTLAAGETTAIDATPLYIRFDRVVEDSRCPTDVVCIQAGDGVIGITVLEQGGGPRSYQLHTATSAAQSVTHGSLTITLEQLTPAPTASRKPAARDYRATLRVRR